MHHADDVAAVVVEYFPLVQSEQANDPGNELYPPAGQSAHSADPNEALCLPAEQITHPTQLLSDVEPVVVRYLPLPQLLHAADPVELLYLPAAQAPQVPPSAPVKPRLHLQSPAASLPVPE